MKKPSKILIIIAGEISQNQIKLTNEIDNLIKPTQGEKIKIEHEKNPKNILKLIKSIKPNILQITIGKLDKETNTNHYIDQIKSIFTILENELEIDIALFNFQNANNIVPLWDLAYEKVAMTGIAWGLDTPTTNSFILETYKLYCLEKTYLLNLFNKSKANLILDSLDPINFDNIFTFGNVHLYYDDVCFN
jgi:hypothetical protein